MKYMGSLLLLLVMLLLLQKTSIAWLIDSLNAGILIMLTVDFKKLLVCLGYCFSMEMECYC